MPWHSGGRFVIGSERRLPADSGGIVWDLHPLPCGRRASRLSARSIACQNGVNSGAKRAGTSRNEVRMSKRSTVTARDQPVADVTSASGAVKVHAETMTIDTRDRLELFDLTDRIMSLVRRLNIREGQLNVFS